MGRREMAVWVAVAVVTMLSVAWLIERRHILTLRQELNEWGKENRVGE